MAGTNLFISLYLKEKKAVPIIEIKSEKITHEITPLSEDNVQLQ